MLISVLPLNKGEIIFMHHVSSILTLQHIGLVEIHMILEFYDKCPEFCTAYQYTTKCH